MKNSLIIVLFMFSINAFANVTLPEIFADNMVLQRNSDVLIWGWANPNEEVVIRPQWSTQEYKIKASNQATWRINIKTPEAGGPFTILIKGYNEIILRDILIGEVWLCSGQSNMEMTPAWGTENAAVDAATANFANIRFFTVPKITATTPQDNLPGKWEACTPDVMRNSSALAYYFARRLQENLNTIPIGLIVSAWGGTPAEVWMPQDALSNNPDVLAAANKLMLNEWGPTEPARAFNAMVYPLIGYKIAGALWYQGESNVGSDSYTKTMSALISSWRKAWKSEFPFYFVQIAPYNYGSDHFGGAIIRDAQRQLLAVANTGMVVTSDISPIDDIHPKDKKSVGVRLANLALTNMYKVNTNVVNGPVFKNAEIKGGSVRLSFDNTDGLYLKNKNTTQFEIAGLDGVFTIASAKIKENTIVLKSKVKDPKSVRFAWSNVAQSELFNSTGLPASTFLWVQKQQ